MKGGTVQINWHDTKPVLTHDFHPISSTLTTGVIFIGHHNRNDSFNLAFFLYEFFLFRNGIKHARDGKLQFLYTRESFITIHKQFSEEWLYLFYKVRQFGVRIAIAYLVAALCEIWLRGDNNVNSGSSLLKNYRFQWAVALILSSIYLALLYGLKVPDWEYHIPIENSTSPASTSFLVKCGVRGDTRLACNDVGMIDRKILGIQHLYRKTVYARSEHKLPKFWPAIHGCSFVVPSSF
ncbi:hypothetical protein UlMin_043897 [Ulmus minor]